MCFESFWCPLRTEISWRQVHSRLLQPQESPPSPRPAPRGQASWLDLYIYMQRKLCWCVLCFIMLYIALLHCSRTMLDLIFVQVEITGFYWSRCLSVGGTIGTNQARHLGKNTWQVLTNAIQNAMTCATSCHILRPHIYLHQLSWANLCQPRGPSNHPWIASGQVERCWTLNNWTIFFSFLNSLLQVDSNVACGNHDVSFLGWLSFQIGRLKKLAAFSEDLADDSFFRVDGKDKSWPFTQGGIWSWLMTVTFVDTLLKWNLNDVIYPSW